jgi:hypothetical protein
MTPYFRPTFLDTNPALFVIKSYAMWLRKIVKHW